MRKMADGFKAVRRAEWELAGEYDPATHEPFLARFDWHQFSDEEFALCPPIFATGGDGAMLDIGFQNLSRLLASGKPIRVMVLDTQVYSNTGGQACTSGFLGQVSDMAAYGKAQHGKTETRKELSLLTIAHRNVFLLQSSQAAPSHLLAGVLRGLQSRYPAVFSLHCPCPPEHGLADDQPPDAAKLAVESRSYPLVVYDPAQGATLAERLSLDGNPAVDDPWPEYELRYLDDAGVEQRRTLPVTTADWAATEARFKRHFTPLPPDARPRPVAVPHVQRAARTRKEAGVHPHAGPTAAWTARGGGRIARLETGWPCGAAQGERAAESRRGGRADRRRWNGQGRLRAADRRAKARYPALVAAAAEGSSVRQRRTIADLLLQVERPQARAGADLHTRRRRALVAPAAGAGPGHGDGVAETSPSSHDSAAAANEHTINRKLFAYNDGSRRSSGPWWDSGLVMAGLPRADHPPGDR
jgi:hypothetical protein